MSLEEYNIVVNHTSWDNAIIIDIHKFEIKVWLVEKSKEKIFS
jgi:hypothetical protein